jgi:hypothetical protein
MTAYCLLSNGDVYSLAPVLPPLWDCRSLSVDGLLRDTAAIARTQLQMPECGPLIRQQLEFQLRFLQHLQHTKSSTHFQYTQPLAEPLLRGPYRFTPAPFEFAEELLASSTTSSSFIGAGEESMACSLLTIALPVNSNDDDGDGGGGEDINQQLGIMLIGYSTGRIDVCALDMADLEGAVWDFDPALGKAQTSLDPLELSGDQSAIVYPDLTIFETIELSNGSRLRRSKSPPSRLVPDPIHPDTVYYINHQSLFSVRLDRGLRAVIHLTEEKGFAQTNNTAAVEHRLRTELATENHSSGCWSDVYPLIGGWPSAAGDVSTESRTMLFDCAVVGQSLNVYELWLSADGDGASLIPVDLTSSRSQIIHVSAKHASAGLEHEKNGKLPSAVADSNSSLLSYFPLDKSCCDGIFRWSGNCLMIDPVRLQQPTSATGYPPVGKYPELDQFNTEAIEYFTGMTKSIRQNAQILRELMELLRSRLTLFSKERDRQWDICPATVGPQIQIQLRGEQGRTNERLAEIERRQERIEKRADLLLCMAMELYHPSLSRFEEQWIQECRETQAAVEVLKTRFAQVLACFVHIINYNNIRR